MTAIGPYEVHPIAEIVPMATEFRRSRLAESISANGLRIKPTRYQGKILDGRNRVAALVSLGIEFEWTEFEGDDLAALQFVIDMSERRDLTDGQRALVAQRAEKLQGKLIRALRKEGKVRTKQPALPHVHEATTEQLEAVQEDGVQELQDKLERGEIEADRAAAIATLEPEQQRRVLEQSEKAEVVRARVVHERFVTEQVELTPIDVTALKSVVFIAEKSVHAEARAGAAVIRRIAPWLK